MARYDGSIRINTQINIKQAQVNLATLDNRMVKTADKIASLRSKMDALKDAKIPTTEYAALEKEFNRLDTAIGKLVDRQIKFLETGGKKNSSAYKRMEYDLAELSQAQDQVISKQKKLEESGKAFTLGSGTEEYKKLGNDLKYAENEMELLKKKHDLVEEKAKSTGNQYKKLGKVGKSSFSAISKGAESAKNGLKKIGSFAAASFSRLSKSADKSGGSFSKFSSRLKGILSSLLIFNWVTKAFNAMVSGMKEGFSNLYNDNKKFKNSVNGLKASVLTLKNSFASAFAPIATVAIPYLQSLVNAISSVMDKVAQFTAAITGQKTYLKAVKQTTAAIEDQGKKANKANKKQLSGLDKLNNLSKEDKDDNDDSSGTGEMFKEVPVSSEILKFANWFKESLDDLEELGSKISSTLSDMMESIDWDSIYKKASGFGKGLAEFLNGLFTGKEGERLFENLGKTIANALNTVLYSIFSFSKEFKWSDFGKALAKGINGFFNNIDIKLAADTINTLAKGILDAMIGVVENVEWDKIAKKIAKLISEIDASGISWKLGKLVNSMVNAFYQLVSNKETWTNLGKKIADGINGFLKGMNEVDKKTGLTGWQALGKSISESMSGMLTTITTALDGVKWEKVGKAIADFISSIDWKGISWKLGKMADSLFNALVSAISSFSKTNPLAAAIIGLFAGLKLTGLSKTFSSLISKSLKGKKLTIGKIVIGISFLAATFKLAGSESKLKSLIAAPITAFIAAQTITGSPKISLTLGSITLGTTAGFSIGSAIYEKLFDKPYPVKFSDIFTYDLEDWKTGFKMWFDDINTWLDSTFKNDFPFNPVEIAVKVAAKFTTTKIKVDSWVKKIVKWWGSPLLPTKNKFNTTKKDTKSWWSQVVEWWGKRYLEVGVKVGKKGIIAGAASGNIPSLPVPSKPKSIKSAEIPKLATGAVIPPNKEFLAVLGDQKHGTNVEAPLDTIKQALREELRLSSGRKDNGVIELYLTVECEGYKLLQLMQRLDAEQYNRTGRPTFQM